MTSENSHFYRIVNKDILPVYQRHMHTLKRHGLSTASPMPSKPGDTSPHTGTTTPEPTSSSTGTAFPEDRDVTTIAGETTPSEEPQPVAIDSQEHTSYQYNQYIDDTSQKTIFPGDPCPNLRDYGAQAPGKPLEVDGFFPPKNWDGKKEKHTTTGQYGWRDKKGNIWVPTGWGPLAHGGPHWDVIKPDETPINIYPGGKTR